MKAEALRIQPLMQLKKKKKKTPQRKLDILEK
jgi:hypothetical protein